MSKTVVAYLAGVPNPQKSPHKLEVLKRFIDGVNKVGDKGINHTQRSLLPADVGMIQGWVHEGSPNSSHLVLRKQVSTNTKNKSTLIVDSNLFNYNLGKLYHKHYSRYSMNGVFPTTGNYFWDEIDPTRWNKISSDLQLSLKDWRTKGDHILICTQRNGGWSMKGLNVVDWVNKTVKRLRNYTDRPIVVRGHPGDAKAKEYLRTNNAYTVSKNEKIIDDFKNAHAVVTYNSSPGVAAAIEGIPVFVTDPDPIVSQAYDVANTSLRDIEDPKTFERLKWVQKLSMCHWKFEELSSGEAWEHIKKYT